MKLADLHDEIEALRARRLAERLAGFDEAALAWLALVPAWSEALARACGAFAGDLEGMLVRAAEARLVARADDRFWMLDGPRQEVIEMWRQGRAGEGEVARMARVVLEYMEDARADVPSPTRRWAALAARLGTPDAGAGPWLRRKVAALVEQGCTAEARDWLESAERLARVVPGMLDHHVRLAGHFLERAHLRALDEHELARFLPRAEQIAAFEALLDGPDERWSLHYLGMGGVGKTSLIRYIAARLAPARGALVARIDFDYLSPDYPVSRPGQLVATLAAQLGVYIDSPIQEKYLGMLHDQVLALHEDVAARGQPEDPLDNIRQDGFARLLTSFIELLRNMSAPVVLVLDTCEEIAKLSPAGGRLPAVDATFEILERVQARVPRLRVVIAGRRLLARAGHGWGAREAALSELEARLPARKAYLGLHLIRGFTQAEARRFLHQCLIAERPADLGAAEEGAGAADRDLLGQDLLGAILARSPEPGWPDVIERDDGAGDDERRYSPFDLRLYADLVADEPALDAADLAGVDGDPYVELRIVRRVGALEELLPAVALLGRFDRDMLAAVAGAGVDRVFAELGAQEWIAAYSDEAGGSGFLEVREPLQERLRAYYGHPERRAQREAARRALAAGLAALVRERPLRKLGAPHLDAALGLGEVDAAIALWRAVELRIPVEASWGWAWNITRELLGEGGAARERGSVLNVVVRSTYAAASIRHQPASEVAAQWSLVVERAFAGAPAHDRARLGLAAWSGRRAAVVAGLRPAVLWQRLAGWLDAAQAAACVCAAVEGMLERAEEAGDARLLVWPAEQIDDWLAAMQGASLASGADFDSGSAVEPGLLAFARCLLGRALALEGHVETAREHVLAAAHAVEGLAVERHRDAWLDWREPACLRDRVRLEALRLLGAQEAGLDVAMLGRWLDETLLDTIDGERLAARIWMMRLASAPPDAAVLRGLRPHLAYVARRRPVCRAHADTPPLFVVVARGLVEARAVGEGEALAREHLEAAIVAADDPDTVHQAKELLGWVRAGAVRVSANSSAKPAAPPPMPPAAAPMPSAAAPPQRARRIDRMDSNIMPSGAKAMGDGKEHDPFALQALAREEATDMAVGAAPEAEMSEMPAPEMLAIEDEQPRAPAVVEGVLVLSPAASSNAVDYRYRRTVATRSSGSSVPGNRFGVVELPARDAAYHTAASRMSQHIVPALPHMPAGGWLGLPMRVARAIAACPWEAYLALGNGARMRALAPYRLAAGTRGRPEPDAWRLGAVCMVATDAWRASLEASWHGLAEVTAHAHHGVHAVFHIIGMPMDTAAGVRLRIEDERRPGKKTAGRGASIAEYDMPFVSAWLAVVQARPLHDEHIHRGPLERAESHGLREFAASLIDAGTHAVLMLPALPLAVARVAVAALAGALRSEDPPRQAELVAAAHAVRQAILDATEYASEDATGESGEAARWEMAFDVTLFVREEH